MKNYGPKVDVLVNSKHILTIYKAVFQSGETSVIFHNNLTGAETSGYYKTEAAANGQITKMVHRAERVYG